MFARALLGPSITFFTATAWGCLSTAFIVMLSGFFVTNVRVSRTSMLSKTNAETKRG